MDQREAHLHYIMSWIGGFLGVLSILCFSSLFGSAQTSNLILLVTSLLGADWGQLLLRLGGMALYMAAIALTVYLPRRCCWDLRLISVALDGAAAAAVGLLPADIPPVLGLYPLFFAMAFQWNSFSGAGGFVSSTIFSTNNLRQFTMAVTEIFLNHDCSHLPKAAFFGRTLLSFHAGVAVSFLLFPFFERRTAWFCLLPCALAFFLVRARGRAVPPAEAVLEQEAAREEDAREPLRDPRAFAVKKAGAEFKLRSCFFLRRRCSAERRWWPAYRPAGSKLPPPVPAPLH